MRSAAEVQILAGRQTARNARNATRHTTDEAMEAIHGLMKFEMRYSGTAKEMPQTRMGGITPFVPRQPAKAQINQNGTIIEKSGS